MEVIVQEFPVEVVHKKDQLYLMYTNDEKEKVIIKCDEGQLTMTRFSNPKSIMRFMADKETVVILATPIGNQHFVTATKHYQLDLEAQSLVLHYDLKQLEADGIFASYQLEIFWS